MDKLSPLHLKVLRLVGEAKSNLEISQDLGVCERTVKYKITDLLRFYGCRTRYELMLPAVIANTYRIDTAAQESKNSTTDKNNL